MKLLGMLKTFNRQIFTKNSSFFWRTFSSDTKSTNNDSNYVEMIDFDDSKAVPIPIYEQKVNEPLNLRKARLLYQSRKRGMLENGLLLSTFADKYLNSMNENEIILYDKLINQPTNDWEIFYWATGHKPVPEEYNSPIMDLLKKHVSNPNKETRIRQPDLKF